MIATKLTFKGVTGPVEIEWDTAVVGKESEIQRVAANLYTTRGSDPVLPEHGTTLLRAAINGRLGDIASAQHFCNFAATDSLFFTSETVYGDIPRIEEITIEPAALRGTSVNVNIHVKFPS